MATPRLQQHFIAAHQLRQDLDADRAALTDQKIHAAILHGHYYELKGQLSESPFMADTRSHAGDTPLHIAARLGDDRAVEMLIAARASVNAMTLDFKTAVDLASENGHQTAAAKIAKAGGKTSEEIRALPVSDDELNKRPERGLYIGLTF